MLTMSHRSLSSTALLVIIGFAVLLDHVSQSQRNDREASGNI
jgi:hypothetical protein